MAVFEYFQNMYDVRLKPRMLRLLIKDHLPDENHPFSSPSDLSNVVSAIKTHGLLNETIGEPMDQKLLDKWNSAIDAWIERLLLLVSSKMPDKSWAGICLLGVTCQECSIDRFLASYSSWFQKLLSQIQTPSDSQFVKVATCASLSDMFTRLSGVLKVKKDGTSLSGKIIQPVLKLLEEDGSEAVWEGAVDLFCTLVNFFPSSVHRHYDIAEAVIVSKIMSGKCTVNMSKKFAHCLALLPKARGDEETWSLMMQRILISINVHLDDAFQGLEEESKRGEAIRLLVPPGKDPPSPLGGQVSGETSDQSDRLLSKVSTLMLSCSMMLANSYPVQVTVAVRSLLALIRRVLLVDGSMSRALMTVREQADICSELPVLHLYSLDILIAIIKGIRSKLLPNAADIVRLITEYSRRCGLSALRIKVYSIMEILLIYMGVGIAPFLAQEVINNVFADLDSFGIGNGVASSNAFSKPATYTMQRPSHRKRKLVTVSASTEDDQNGSGLEVEVPKSKSLTPLSVQIAALQALEALITVGGAVRSECWRANADLLLITVATNVCDRGWGIDEKGASAISGEVTLTWADFQLAALRALLASLLSPARVRPPYLSQGLELFRRGKQEAGTKLAGFCAHALLALEVLIHPRALPLMDSSFSNYGSFEEGFNQRFPDKMFSSHQKDSTPFSRGVMGMGDPDPDDELYASWLRSGEDCEAPVTSNTDQKMESCGAFCEEVGQKDREDPPTVVDGSVGVPIANTGNREQPTSRLDEMMVDAERLDGSSVADVGRWDKGAMEARDGLRNLDKEVVSGICALDEGALITSSSTSDKGKKFMYEDESDISDIPSPVDGDPDSDNEVYFDIS